MAKKTQVMGIQLNNYSVRESMLLLEEYMNTESLNIVGVISTDLLLAASKSEETRDWINSLDMHIIGDVAIFEVLEEEYTQQIGELQRRELEEQFLKALIRKKKTVYWIGESKEQQEAFRTYVEEHYAGLSIAGFSVKRVEEEDSDVDVIINDINSDAPDVILMSLSSPLQERFVLHNKNRLNTKLCICLGFRLETKYDTKMKNSKIKTLIDQTLFKRKAMKYMLDVKNKSEK